MTQILFGVLLGIGIFLVAADIWRIPFFRTSKATVNLSKRQSKKTGAIELWLKGLSEWLAKHLRLNEYKRIQLTCDLDAAGMNISPEQHIANAVVKAGLCSLLTIPAFFIFPLITPLVVALAIAMYFKESQGVRERIKEKRQAIEYELGRLVFAIEKTLMHNRDILAILDSYRENAGEELKRQLSVTVADMRSGNYESALTRLESRVGSSMLSDIVRGLISVLRGDETSYYWASLSVKFSDIQRQMLKKEAMKVPGKVKRLSMCLLFCFMAMYIAVLGVEIMSSIGAMFT